MNNDEGGHRHGMRGATLRDAVLDATERLLGRCGYQKMTMDDIAREAGVGRRTLYLHFTGKEEIALSSIDRVVERLLDVLRGSRRRPGVPPTSACAGC
jgi:AcrR family transcriptional regulator